MRCCFGVIANLISWALSTSHSKGGLTFDSTYTSSNVCTYGVYLVPKTYVMQSPSQYHCVTAFRISMWTGRFRSLPHLHGIEVDAATTLLPNSGKGGDRMG